MQRHVSMTDVDAPDVAHVGPASGWDAFEARPLPPFAPVIRTFVSALSERLMRAGRTAPDLAALGFWLRPRQVELQAERMAGRASLGVVLHLVPSNVPTVAFHSWLMALLMGNASVVRLSARIDPQQDVMLDLLSELLADPAFAPIARRTRFIRYGHDDRVTAWLGARCDLRIVWGGDATITAIRAVPMAPHAQEVVFPDRRSMAIVEAGWLATLDAQAFARLAQALGDDCTRFNQRACASPTTFVWLGKPESDLRGRLLEAVFAAFRDDPARAMDRLVHAQLNAAELGSLTLEARRGVMALAGLGPVGLPHVGGGVVAEWVAPGWDALLEADLDVQTCVFAGSASLTEVRAKLALAAGRVDRVVAPGQALAFDWFQDGVELTVACSRALR